MSTKQYDALSDMRIPFEVAAWARGHKFNQTTVAILRKLQEIKAQKERMEYAEAAMYAAEEQLRALCDEAKRKMEVSHAV